MTTEFFKSGLTAPVEAIPLTTTGRQSETREGHDSTPEAGDARTLDDRRMNRRSFLRGGSRFIVALAAAGAVGGGGVWAMRDSNKARTGVPLAPEVSPSVERKPIAIETTNLYAMQHSRPETLNAPTFEGVIENLQDALNFAVATNDTELLKRLIPGPPHGILLPDPFMYRATYYENLHTNTHGDPTDPEDLMFRSWGCNMEVLNVEPGSNTPTPDAPGSRKFYATVRMTMGDQPTIVGGKQPFRSLEDPVPFETRLEISRIGGLLRAGSWDEMQFPDINNEPGSHGWAFINASQMMPISPFMQQHQPTEWSGTIPPPFADYDYTPR